jgi:hypothetical protein
MNNAKDMQRSKMAFDLRASCGLCKGHGNVDLQEKHPKRR